MTTTIHPRIRRFTALVGTAALVSGAGLGVAQAQDTTTTPAKPAKSARPHGGPSAAQVKALAEKLGVSTTELRSAMAATRPSRTAGARRGGPGDMAAAIATALDADPAKVQSILESSRPVDAAPPKPGTKPDTTALVAALATGLGLEQSVVSDAVAKVEAAKRAEHEARHAEMAAALAEKLGLTTAKVQAALEATRPAKPAR